MVSSRAVIEAADGCCAIPRIEVPVDAVSDARGGCLDGVSGEMGVSGGRLDLRVSEQFSYHGQALAERQRAGSERLTDVVNVYVVQSGLDEDALPDCRPCARPAMTVTASVFAGLSLLLTPSGAETLVFWVSQPLAWLVAPKDVPLMTRRGDLKLSHGATAKARENAVKQDRVPTTNAIKSL